MCRALSVNERGYYKWVGNGERPKKWQPLLAQLLKFRVFLNCTKVDFFKKSVWKKIAANVFRGVEEFVEREEGRMPDADYLKLLLNYQVLFKKYRREWEV